MGGVGRAPGHQSDLVAFHPEPAQQLGQRILRVLGMGGEARPARRVEILVEPRQHHGPVRQRRR